MVERVILAIIFIIVGVILLTSQAVTINENTDTSAGSQLENVSDSAKSIYSLYDFLWAILGIGLIVGGFVVFFQPFGRKGRR